MCVQMGMVLTGEHKGGGGQNRAWALIMEGGQEDVSLPEHC